MVQNCLLINKCHVNHLLYMYSVQKKVNQVKKRVFIEIFASVHFGATEIKYIFHTVYLIYSHLPNYVCSYGM